VLRHAVPRLLSYANDRMDDTTGALAEELLAVAVRELLRGEPPVQLMAALVALVDLSDRISASKGVRAMAAEVYTDILTATKLS